jgi:hypothetical protein
MCLILNDKKLKSRLRGEESESSCMRHVMADRINILYMHPDDGDSKSLRNIFNSTLTQLLVQECCMWGPYSRDYEQYRLLVGDAT